jgi:hypothetical protein
VTLSALDSVIMSIGNINIREKLGGTVPTTVDVKQQKFRFDISIEISYTHYNRSFTALKIISRKNLKTKTLD